MQAVGGAHGNGTHDAVAKLLLYLEGNLRGLQLERIINLGNGTTGEFHVHHRTDDLHDLALIHGQSLTFQILLTPPPHRRRFRKARW
jgi:hypothetical protein